MTSKVRFYDGEELNIYEKNLFFSKAYKRITVNKQSPLLISTPVLEYVFQLYNIVRDGISKRSFKLLLFSNWYYHTGVSEVKWDKYIGTFKQIEAYLRDNVTIEEWIMQMKDMLTLKCDISNNPLYKFHPFNAVDFDDLQFLLDLLSELNVMVNLLSIARGNVQYHLDFLRKNILKIDKILSNNYTDLSEQQQNIKKFYDVLKSIVSDSTIAYLDTDHFSRHLKTLFSNAVETDQVESNENFILKVSSMINLKRYKHTFFISCENDKYPRKNNNLFPLTDSIVNILRSEKYGIQINNLPIKSQSFHLKLEKYLFKNVLDFTTEDICFTSSEYTGKNKNTFSVYIKDLAIAFNNYINFDKPEINNQKDIYTDIYSIPHVYVNPKKIYTIKELVTFQLCPKLYYHLYVRPTPLARKNKGHLKMYAESIFYNALLGEFMDYNYKNKKWYYSNSQESFNVLYSLSDKVFKNNIKYFDCLRIPDVIEIKDRVVSRIKKIIEDYIINKLGYHKYTMVRSNGKIYPCGQFDVKLEYDTAIYTDKKGSRKIEQNSIYLDFLTLKCTKREVPETHYNDMLNVLGQKNKFTDRIFFTNRIISKINVQFDSGNKSFIYGKDGAIERVKVLREKILQTDFSSVSPYPSNFCSYCIMNDVCYGERETNRDLEVIE